MSTAITVILWMLVAMLGLGVLLSVVVFTAFCFHVMNVIKEEE